VQRRVSSPVEERRDSLVGEVPEGVTTHRRASSPAIDRPCNGERAPPRDLRREDVRPLLLGVPLSISRRLPEEYLGTLSGFWWFNDTHLSS
jgi:hypothetical protein